MRLSNNKKLGSLFFISLHKHFKLKLRFNLVCNNEDTKKKLIIVSVENKTNSLSLSVLA